MDRDISNWVPERNPRKGNEVPHGNGIALGFVERINVKEFPMLGGQERYAVTVEFEVPGSIEEIDKIEKDAQRLLTK